MFALSDLDPTRAAQTPLGVDLSASRAIQVAIVVFVKFNHGHDASSAR